MPLKNGVLTSGVTKQLVQQIKQKLYHIDLELIQEN